MLESLRDAVNAHAGEFSCVDRGEGTQTKVVPFRHIGSEPDDSIELPDVPGLRDFYSTFDDLALYVDEESGDAAYYIASPSEWSELDSDFRPWLEGAEDGIDDGEHDEVLPPWLADCLVIGEIPQSGNYLLVPVEGEEAGMVFEFEHDGFEFIELAQSLPDFVLESLDLDESRLSDIASHLTFIGDDDDTQWWIQQMKDNRGNVVRTEAF